jgi:hypothetical protein
MLLLEVLDVELLVKVVAVDVMLVTCRYLQSNICTVFFLRKTNINRVLDRLCGPFCAANIIFYQPDSFPFYTV